MQKDGITKGKRQKDRTSQDRKQEERRQGKTEMRKYRKTQKKE